MIIDEEDYLAHYGVLRRSGRYPWGSGGPEVASNKGFVDHVAELKRQGMSESDICIGMGIGRTDRNGVFHPSTTQLRAANSIAKHELKQDEIRFAQSLKDKGYKNTAIAERMGRNESYVRTLLAPGAKDKADSLMTTANALKEEVKNKKYLDVGAGTEYGLGVTQTKLNTAIAMCQEEGYVVHSLKQPQLGTGKDTTRKILTPPGTPWSDVQKNQDKIQLVSAFSEDGGRHFGGLKKHEPVSIHPNRVAVRYKEDGGANADGVIYVRPGVEDLSLGSAHYAQVRIKVGDSHYLKGMAMQHDGLPDGVDVLFNTNKSNTGNKLDALKELENDPDLPFGSITRPLIINPGHPDEHVKSAMNIVNEEGAWGKWSKTLSSQMLSKQSPSLARTQLDVTFERRQQELADIMALTNPVVKKKLLESYAEATDAASVHLKAAALPRQSSQVILPIESMKDTEVYAPNYRHGEKVVLIRHPHGGTFEIPELTVNNRHPEAVRVLGDAKDAIGINHKVAQHLSGADFDGDSVLVIPNNKKQVKISPALESLKDFDTMKYKIPEHPDKPGELLFPKISDGRKQQLMGEASNLITDMTLRQASHEELARAVKYSMVVIDAHKHALDHKAAARDFGIKALRQEYQQGPRGGASTIVSRAKSPTFRNELKPRPHPEGGPIDRVTGKRVFVETGRLNPDGTPHKRRYKKLAIEEDAHKLIDEPGTPMERLYADHSNKLKDLANQARLASINTPRLNYSPSANKAYKPEVDSLMAKLAIAKRNAPLERHAQQVAKTVVNAKKAAHPNLEPDDIKKIKQQALTEARNRFGASKKERQITIEDKEWDAIQAGAITGTALGQILRDVNIDVVRERATPRTQKVMTKAMTSRARAMRESGYTRAEVADALGVSTTTLDLNLKGGE